MSPPSPASSCTGEHCITCADEGVPMTVLALDARRGLALCADVEGARHTVDTALVEPLVAGRGVLVHAGVAIASIAGEADEPAGATRALRTAQEAPT